MNAIPLATLITSELLAAMPHDGSASFGQDLAFLKGHTRIHLLEDPQGARVIVAPAWQGRVMTSSARGDEGLSFGWIHYENVKVGIRPEGERRGLARHIHVFGGEERMWLGPEGGQHGLFFPPAPVPYTFENWHTPAVLDTDVYEVVASDPRAIELKKDAVLHNRAGTRLAIGIARRVELLDRPAVAKALNVELPGKLRFVAYRTTNRLVNRGETPWSAEHGLVSIWMLGMYKHGPGVTVVIPLRQGEGPAVNSDYFGSLDSSRLRVTDKAAFFKADGKFRSKIGVPPGRSNGVAGSYDPERRTLTIVRCDVPPAAEKLPYVRSQWEDHVKPYAGDLMNAYNDGPATPGEPPLGPFHEVETSSPAAALAPGATMTHVQDTMHFEGEPEHLDIVARRVLGVDLRTLSEAFSPKLP